MGRLSGKRALVTGAGGLLGSDIARAFAAEGADLVLTTRTASKLIPVEEDVMKRGVRCKSIDCDFNVPEAIDRLGTFAWDAFGGIEIVVLSSQPPNPRLGDLLSTPVEVWRDQFQSIFWGPLRLMKQLAPRMMDAGGGSVITLTSSTGKTPFPGFDAYGLAKGALWLMTRYMAKEWGPKGIRANSVEPGSIATTGRAEDRVEQLTKAGILQRTALRRPGVNSECVGALVYLASDESTFTSGQNIVVDGGLF